jgi:hypothetical protein
MKKTEIERSDNILHIEKEQIHTNDKWEIELSNNDCVVLQNSGPVPTKILFFNIVTNSKNFWEFKSVDPGEFTVFNLHYHPGGMWLDYENSYAEDYYVDETLEIHSNGKKPIYEVEKYDRYLFEQYVDQIKRNFDRSFEAEKFTGIKYSITSDYQTKTIFLTIQNNNYDEEKLIEFTEDEMDFYLNNFGTVSAEYNYSIIIE